MTDGADTDVSSSAGHIANVNPLRYRGYYYDSETGFYYLNSRYYDPETCRFINADGLIDNREIGYQNMFAYCGNNPVANVDESGQAPFKVSRYLFCHFLVGASTRLMLNSASLVSKSLKKSKTMKGKIEEEIDKYERGEEYGSGSVTFTSSEPDLWLSVRNADYVMKIEKETKETGWWILKKIKTRYIVNVTVCDIYDFNTGNEQGDGIGSWLNNIGYWIQEHNIGDAYYWEANYVYKTQWE